MADNVDITIGDGTGVVAGDDIQVDATHAQGIVQFVKLVDGTLNGTGSMRVNQAAKANALTVAPASDITDPTYIGDIKFGEALIAGTNLIGKVGIDQTTPGTTNRVDIGALIPGTAASNLGKAEDAAHTTGDVGVMALTVRKDAAAALGTTDVDYQPLITDANGRLHVLDANSANILTAVQLIDNAIDGNYLNVNLNINGTDCDGGSGAQGAQTLRVILATDDPAVAHLATIAGDTTSMDGKITACNTGAVVISSGTVTTVSTVTSLTQMGGVAITMGEGALDGGCQRVTLATDDDGVLSLGIIDDWDVTHDSAVSADGPQVMASYDSTKPTAVGDGDAVRMLADAYGRLLAGVEPQAFEAILDSANATAEGVVVHASAPSTIIVVQSYVISVDAEMWVKLQDEEGVAKTGKFWLKAGGGVAITLPDKAPIVLAVNKDLEVITEGAGNISVSVTGYTIPG